MGSGKTFIGRQLAERLGLRFVDLDGHVEQLAGKSISQIFAVDGETAFRELEQSALRQISTLEKIIIATGGGTPCFFENMDLINQNGFSIYLETPVSILAERLKKGIEKRPLLHQAENLEKEIESLLSKRKAVYERAQLYYHRREVEQDIDDLVNYIKSFLG